MMKNTCDCEPMMIGSGTQAKIQVSNLPIGDLTMDDYYFELEAYTTAGGRRSQRITKDQATRVDANHYTVIIDTALLGLGELWVDQTAFIPDGDAPSGQRREVSVSFTNLIVVKRR